MEARDEKIRTWTVVVAILVVWFAALGCAQAEATPEAEDFPRKVGWEDLKKTVEFEDPFEALSEEQLLDLGIIARVESLEKREGDSREAEGREGRDQVAAELEQREFPKARQGPREEEQQRQHRDADDLA